MSTTSYNILSSPKGTTIVVTGTVTRVIAEANPRFKEVRSYLIGQTDAGEEIDFAHVLSLIDAGPEAVNKLAQLSDRVTYQNGTLFFDGDEVETALAKHIVNMIKAGDENYGAFVNFLENLSQNPSKKSRKALFEWVQDRNLTITEEGEFVAYKGVRSDGTSVHSGGAIVDGVETTGHIPNAIGSVITMPRSGVDADRDSACSTGLHAGTREYAAGFASTLLIVAINPRDVVMVPKDCGSQKLRVCRYRVLDNNTAELTETTYGAKHAYNPVADQAETFVCADCGDDTPVNEKQDEFDRLCRACRYYANDYCSDCGYPYDDCACEDDDC